MIRDIVGRVTRALAPKRRKPWDPFLDLTQRYERRLKRRDASAAQVKGSRGRVGVLVTPWLSTGVPLLALECTQVLAQEGFQVVALCDFTDVVGNAADPAHDAALRKLVEQLRNAGVLTVLDAADWPDGTPDGEAAALLARQNAIWRMRGEGKSDAFFDERPQVREQIAAHIGRVEAMLRLKGFDWLLIPGGVFGLSGIYVAAARKAGVGFTTFDSGVGALRLAQDGIAAHLGDLPATWKRLQPTWRSDARERECVLSTARAEIEDRTAARDFRQFQVAPAAMRDDLRYDILVPLNIRWDTAALARQRLFASVAEWLEALLAWVGERPGVTMCLRQHPRERLDFAKGSDDWAPLVSAATSLGERVRWVKADEPINTYDLLRHAKAVLPHTSTIGIEASLLGKPVILGTDCYYGDFGFVWNARTREEYFARLDDALAGRLTLSEPQREDAALAYFLTQRCAFIRSDFNPHRENFLRWCETSPEELWSAPETADYRTALLSREPLSLVRYRRLTGAAR